MPKSSETGSQNGTKHLCILFQCPLTARFFPVRTCLLQAFILSSFGSDLDNYLALNKPETLEGFVASCCLKLNHVASVVEDHAIATDAYLSLAYVYLWDTVQTRLQKLLFERCETETGLRRYALGSIGRGAWIERLKGLKCRKTGFTGGRMA